MKEEAADRIEWYRVPVSREDLNKLNRRSDLKGLLQSVGFLAVLAASGSAAFYSASHWSWWLTVLLTYLHGMFWGFLLNGFHELCHGTVFRSRALNAIFLRVYSFLGQFNYVHFQESHRRHHKYTLHPPRDLEVTLPIRWKLRSWLRMNVFDYSGIYRRPLGWLRASLGKLEGEWNERILPSEGVSRRDEYVRWARIVLVGHALIVVVSLSFGLWMIPVLVTMAPLYGTWLRFFCNDTQHVGLQDNVDDFRLCCRTIYLNPVLQFLYWHMNYHIEHHMYAGIPCYNLGRLHRLIKHQLPPTPNGLIQTWRQIFRILRRQEQEPDYQYKAPLPELA